MSSRATASVSQSSTQRRHRSRSTSRYADLEKPKKKKTLSATTSLVSIPNTIKLSMLNSGLLSFEKIKLEARDQNNSLSQTIPDKPIELRHFVKLCEQRRKFPVLYKLEFQTAVKVETNTCRHALRKNNLDKNQNQKCIPYDYNRVVLEKIPGVPDSDYINASYVDSLLKPNAYIVTQGPTEETVNEFWRMVWQENVSAIVMLTKTFDFTKVMCVQYWPPNVEIHETYGDIHINIVKEEQLANFQIRTFRLYKKNLDDVVTEERLILQFHYTEWHSHTCPFSNAVLEFRRRVRAVVGNVIKPGSMVGPMLVHCNDGGGRSGVYLAIDANLELAEEEDCFHVFGYLKKLRQSRKGLIENVDQYKFVYDTLEEHIICGKTWFPVSELSERLKQKAKRDPVTKMNEYQKEYAQICKQTPRFTIGDCAGGHRADNREKNRDVLCVPPDNFRPYLTSFQGNAFTDYINSVFVDGYTKPREYIVTEWPLKHTLGEFWSLVYDHECSAVVVLCQPPPNSQQYPAFWPQKSKMEKYGPVFSVHFASGKHYQNIKQWEFKINKKIISLTEMMAGVKAPTKTVQLFQLTCWPMGHKVPTSTNSLVFLMNMVELWRQKTDYGPVCVVSPDGRSRAGVYCAANACIEQVVQHGEVDVFQAVKTVRRHRPQLVDNMTEYKYCYDLVLHYVLHFLDKEHKEKKFIAFGRGKHIPLTPDNQNSDFPTEISNTGRIVVKKCIDKIDKRETLLQQQQQQLQLQKREQKERQFYRRTNTADRNGKIMERKTKGRLYSVGGNEPLIRKGYRGRLDRLKTVGTFDLGTEISVLSEVARNLNEKLITGEPSVSSVTGYSSPSCGDQSLSTTTTYKYATSSATPTTTISMQSTSVRNTPESYKRQLNKSISSIRTTSDASGRAVTFRRGPPGAGRGRGEDGAVGGVLVQTQHSADDCIQRKFYFGTERKSRSLSTSGFLNRVERGGIEWAQPPHAQFQQQQLHDERIKRQRQQSPILPRTPGRTSSEDGAVISSTVSAAAKTSESAKAAMTKSVEFSKTSSDISADDKADTKKEFSYMKRRSMLRKSKRIVRTDSEIFREGIVGSTESGEEEKSEKNVVILQNNTDIQIHLKSTSSADDNEDQQQQQQTLKHPPPSSLLQARAKMSSSQDYTERNSSVTSSSVFSRKNSSDFDDLCSPKEYQYRQSTTTTTTTTDSSKNQSAEEIDAVFSDSTQDLETLEKEYKELMKSNLQREYKSDGDTLDEIGKKKRDDFSKWKNQSLEHEFGLTTIVEPSSSKEEPAVTVTSTTAAVTTKTLQLTDESYNLRSSDTASSDLLVVKDLSRICSPESCATSAYSDSGVVKGFDIPSVGGPSMGGTGASNLRLRVYSSSRVGETPTERERLSYYPSSHHQHSSTDDDYDIEMMTPSKAQHYQHSQSISMYSDGDAGEDLLQLHKTSQRPSILKIDKKSTTLASGIQQKEQPIQKQKSADTASSEHETSSVVKCSSIFDNPLSKFKKVNKLLRCKRFSTSVLYDKKPVTETISADAAIAAATTTTSIAVSGTTSSAPSAAASTTNIPATMTSSTTSSTSKKDGSPSMKPLKKKRAIHLSKLSLFRQKHRKQSAAATGISLSNHELTSKSNITKQKLSLSETSKSTCEISKISKTSPLRFSRKSSKRGDKSGTKSNVSSDQQQQHTTCQSPLSEEFYNKTGSVRLSAIELYEKFCSEDFGGLYKHENDDHRVPYPFGNNQHEYRLEKKGLRAIGRYHKNAKLLKQKSEPKFHHYLSSSSRTTTDTFYHEEEEYYYDTHPDEDEYYYAAAAGGVDGRVGGHYGIGIVGDPYYNEQDEYYDEYEDEEDDVEGYDRDYYEDDDHEGHYDNIDEENLHDAIRPKTALGAFDGGLQFRKVDEDIGDEDEDDTRNIIATVGIGTVSLSSSADVETRSVEKRTVISGISEINYGTDSDVDEIFLMPSEGSKCSGSDYEEYGFENKQFTLEQNILKSYDVKDVNLKVKVKSDDRSRSGDGSGSSSTKDIVDDVLTIYKICSREYLDKSFGAFKKISYSSNDSLHHQKHDDDDDGDDIEQLIKFKQVCKKEKTKAHEDYAVIDDDGLEDNDDASSKKYRSLSLQCGESLQKVVSDYVKLSTTSSDQHIQQPTSSPQIALLLGQPPSCTTTSHGTRTYERMSSLSTGRIPTGPQPAAISTTSTTSKTESLDTSDKTDSGGGGGGGSLELLSTQTNSSSGGTIRSHSTLTEYAFDTVKNLNMDSCSTNSKLSLSLKSEIFDDFTITPDDLKKPITNKCDIEDFTLTPDGSLSDENTKCISNRMQQHQQSPIHFKYDEATIRSKKDEDQIDEINDDKDENGRSKPLSSSSPPPPPSLTYDDDDNTNNGKLDDNVILIVNEFLAKERNLPKAEEFLFSSSTSGSSSIRKDIQQKEQEETLKHYKKPTQSIVDQAEEIKNEEKELQRQEEKTKEDSSSSSNINDIDDDKIIAAAKTAKIVTSKPSLHHKTNNDSTDEFTSIDFTNTSSSNSQSNRIISGNYNRNVDAGGGGGGSSSSTKYTTDDTDDNYNEYDDEQMSLFTSELTKEFDKLFSKAEQFINEQKELNKNDDIDKQQKNIDHADDHDVDCKNNAGTNDNLENQIISSTVAVAAIVKATTLEPTSATVQSDDHDDDGNRTVADLPSRYSMQKLEPLDFFDYHYDDGDDNDNNKKCKKQITTTSSSPGTKMKCTLTTSSSSTATTASHSQCSKNNKKLQKQNRSQSLGNLNKKTKCFPL